MNGGISLGHTRLKSNPLFLHTYIYIFYSPILYLYTCLFNIVCFDAGFLKTRLGPTRADESGGNLALKDLTAALRWVKENIAAFGGDPARVTVLGHDTGAALTNLLLISPRAKGLLNCLYSSTSLVKCYINHFSTDEMKKKLSLICCVCNFPLKFY